MINVELILLDVLREVLEGRPDIKGHVDQLLRDRQQHAVNLEDFRKETFDA